MVNKNESYLAAHRVTQDLWQAIHEADPRQDSYQLWVMAANVCQGFSFQLHYMGCKDEANTFTYLQDLAATRADMSLEERRPSNIFIPSRIAQSISRTV